MRKTLCICCMLLALLFFACEKPALPPVETAAPSPEPTPVELPDEDVVETIVPETTTAPTLPPTPEPTPEPTPAPTPEPTPEPTPAPSPFGILWLPDTQLLSYSYPEKLTALGKEIAARREPENLIAVVHTGDLVDNGFKDWEWDNFDLCLSAFSDDLPFYPIAGNHDLGVNLLQYTAYLKRPFLEKLPQDLNFGGGRMYAVPIERDDVRVLLLFVSWDCGKTDDERAWLDGIFAQYPDTPCILITHAFLKDDGSLHSRGAHLESYVVARHPNVKLVLCGHRRGAVTATRSYDDDGDGTPDRTVHVLMLNRQTGSFQYRVLRFDPLTRAIEIRTYSLGKNEIQQTEGKNLLSFTLENMF